MERFTSRRQHSDSNLHRMLAHAWGHPPLNNVNNSQISSMQKKSTSDFLDESITTSDRRSFKWRSLFSTTKSNLPTNTTTKITSPDNLNLEKISRRFNPGSTASFKKMPFNKTSGLGSNERILGPLLEDSSVTDTNNETQNYNGVRRNSTNVVFRQTTESNQPFNRHSFQVKSFIKSLPILEKKEESLKKLPSLETTRPFSVIGVGDFENLIGVSSALSEFRITENNNQKLIEFVQMHEKVKAAEKTIEKLEVNDSKEDNLNYTEKESNKIQKKLGINSNTKNPESSLFINQKIVNREKAKRYNYYNNYNSLKKPVNSVASRRNRRATTGITAANLPSSNRPYSPMSLTESVPLTSTSSSVTFISTLPVSTGKLRKKRLCEKQLRRQSIHANMILNAKELYENSIEEQNNIKEQDKLKKSPTRRSAMVVLRTKKKSKTLPTNLENLSNGDMERCVVTFIIFTIF